MTDVEVGPFGEGEDATPLDADERQGLRPTYIAYRHELNAAEQANIASGAVWAWSSRRKKIPATDLVGEDFLRDLHRRMLGEVWTWAGEYRRSMKTVGVVPFKISSEMRMLRDDARWWIEHQTYEPDEQAVRFHHKLVRIHPFPNGNGRHSRLAADLLVVSLGKVRLTWGGKGGLDIARAGEVRGAYVAALKEADHGDIRPLLAFARS